MIKSEFAQILEQKISKINMEFSSQSLNFNSEAPSPTIDFINLASTKTFFFHSPSLSKNYSSYKTTDEEQTEKCVQKDTSSPEVHQDSNVRIYLSQVNGATYVAWLKLRNLGTSAFQMDSLTLQEAKKAYRNLAKLLHPDTTNELSSEGFITLKAAYDVIEETFTEVFDTLDV